MVFTQNDKDAIKRELAEVLSRETEVQKVVVFGSFMTSSDPHDLDLAVFQSSDEEYLTLAMRYRRDLRPIARRIPIDVIPLKAGAVTDPFVQEIERGETVYER
jgi:predicted nucleotidyltransferase